MLSASLLPCCRYRPAGVERCISQISAPHAAFTPSLRARPPRLKTLGVTYAFTFVTARQLAHHPEGGFVNGLQSTGLPPLCHSSYKVLAFTLVGLTPTERASLRWAHKDVFSNRLTALWPAGPQETAESRSDCFDVFQPTRHTSAIENSSQKRNFTV